MASKVFPALLLLGLMVTLITSSAPATLRSVTLHLAPARFLTDTPKVEMKQYWMVLLEKGPNRERHSPADAAKIQARHLAQIDGLAASGKLLVAGPFGDNGPLRGIFIMNCDSLEAVALVKSDTAVQTGRLIFQIRPWWTAKNCVFK